MNPDRFKIIILLGRPAAGKSEVIDFLKKTPVHDRLKRFHIGEFEEFDDFVYVWETFETDDILSRHGKERIWTDKKYYFKDEFIWNLFIEKINLAYEKRIAANPDFHQQETAIVEFSRGGTNGFAQALSHLSERILKNAGIVYIKVSYEESVRKNRKRAKKGQEHSILHHSLPDEKMDHYYKINDWDRLEAKDPNAIDVRGIKVPYAILPNEPEVTDDPEKLGIDLEETLQTLWRKISHVENR